MRGKVKSWVIGFVNKTGSPLKMENMVARKHAIAATRNHVLATIEMSIIAKVMCGIMAKLFVDLNGSFRISENMDARSLVICVNSYLKHLRFIFQNYVKCQLYNNLYIFRIYFL